MSPTPLRIGGNTGRCEVFVTHPALHPNVITARDERQTKDYRKSGHDGLHVRSDEEARRSGVAGRVT